MKNNATKLLTSAAGGGVLGALLVGGAPAIAVGAALGAAARLAWGRVESGGGSGFGADGRWGLGAATIEEARYAKSSLQQRVFSRPDVPWWLVGVGIGGQPGSYVVLVTVGDANVSPAEVRAWIPKESEGVPVVADATGAQSLEMATGAA